MDDKIYRDTDVYKEKSNEDSQSSVSLFETFFKHFPRALEIPFRLGPSRAIKTHYVYNSILITFED